MVYPHHKDIKTIEHFNSHFLVNQITPNYTAYI
jgi:hypothetical protein